LGWVFLQTFLLFFTIHMLVLGINLLGQAAGISLGAANFYGLDQTSAADATIFSVVAGVIAIGLAASLGFFLLKQLRAAPGWTSAVGEVATGVFLITSLHPLGLIFGVITLVFGIRACRANREIARSMKQQCVPS
jgi:energy-converting hydrogenase Eha subunit B